MRWFLFHRKKNGPWSLSHWPSGDLFSRACSSQYSKVGSRSLERSVGFPAHHTWAKAGKQGGPQRLWALPLLHNIYLIDLPSTGRWVVISNLIKTQHLPKSNHSHLFRHCYCPRSNTYSLACHILLHLLLPLKSPSTSGKWCFKKIHQVRTSLAV